MDASPSYFDPEDLSSRERFRRYGYLILYRKKALNTMQEFSVL